MNSSLPGIIIALLIAFLVGLLAGYAWVRRRLQAQTEALKLSQRRLEELEQSHELRLRETSDRLRQDYETELAETIEHYQDQLSQKIVEMEQIYKTRFSVLQRGETAMATASTAHPHAGLAAIPEPPPQTTALQHKGIEPIASDTPQALTQPELRHLKRQYEIRLKEAAQKLQKAYEKQLADHAKATRADLQREYEQKLAQKSQEYEQQWAERQAQLEQELAEARSTATSQSMITGAWNGPTPSEIMGTGDDTTVTLAASDRPFVGQSPPDPTGQYTQSELDDRIQAATAAAETRYEQQLTQRLEEQQVQFDRRFRELENEYKKKLADLKEAAPQSVLSSVDDLFGETTEEQEDLAASNPEPSPERQDKDWLDNDDDDFGPLDLSDISQLT